MHHNNFPTWRNRKHAAHWISTLETYVLPTLGDMKIDTIRKRVVLFRLTPIWAAKPETARRVRQGMRSVFSWGKAHDYIKYNVAGEAINAALPVMPKIKAHYRSLPYQDVPAALSAIEEARASKSAKLCLRFVVLTACRSGDARLATWDEIDREAEVWTVPSHRMKAGREHRVPLSGLALRVVDEAAAIADGSDLLFPSPVRQSRPLSDMTFTKVLRSSGLADRATLHGFRSSFRIWAAERTSASHAALGLAFAHTVGMQWSRRTCAVICWGSAELLCMSGRAIWRPTKFAWIETVLTCTDFYRSESFLSSSLAETPRGDQKPLMSRTRTDAAN